MTEQKNLFDKYLQLLGVEKFQPSFDLLSRIVKAHLIKIPFENISKLIYKKRGINYIPDLLTYLVGIEKYRKTIELNFNNANTYNNWGWSLLEIAKLKSGNEKKI